MFRAKAEIFLNLEQFKNSGFFEPGICLLKFQIFHEDEEKTHYAHPQQDEQICQVKKKATISNRLTLYHDMKDSMVISDSASFVTKTFFIRYADEIVKLGHTVRFCTEVDVKKVHQNTNRFSAMFDPNQPSKLNQFVDNEFFLRIDLL